MSDARTRGRDGETSDPGEPLWGIACEFATADKLLEVARAMRKAGYSRLQAYAPFHVEGLAEAVGGRGNRVALITFIGGLLGGIGGYFMQWYSAVIDYPLNIGGRPLNSWPMFIPVTFELAVLGAALAGFGAVILGNHLPNLYSPVSKAPDFELAMRNRFFLCVLEGDPLFDRERSARLLKSFEPIQCSEVKA